MAIVSTVAAVHTGLGNAMSPGRTHRVVLYIRQCTEGLLGVFRALPDDLETHDRPEPQDDLATAVDNQAKPDDLCEQPLPNR
jgi:hypothetical protein